MTWSSSKRSMMSFAVTPLGQCAVPCFPEKRQSPVQPATFSHSSSFVGNEAARAEPQSSSSAAKRIRSTDWEELAGTVASRLRASESRIANPSIIDVSAAHVSAGFRAGLLAVNLLCPHHEGLDDAAAQRLEHSVEGRGRQAVLEFEFHFEVHARTARADCLEAPRAGQVAEGSVREPHINLRIGGKRVARGEFGLQHTVRNFQRGDTLGGRNIVDPNPDAPG